MWSVGKRVHLSLAAAAAVVLVGASFAQAAYPFDTMTFDTQTFTANGDNTGDAGSWYKSPIPPMNVRFDYGDGNPALDANHSVTWTNTVDHDANGGGSVELSSNYVASVTGSDEKSSFTFDIVGTPANASNISFYLMLDPASAVDTNGTNDGSQADSGYAQVFVRDNSYNDVSTSHVFVNGNDQGGGWNLGDPTYGPTSDKGTWEFISVPLDASNDNVRGITIQDYDDNSTSGRNLDGPVTMYIDDLTITPAPEPASLALLGLGLPAMLMRRRNSVKA